MRKRNTGLKWTLKNPVTGEKIAWNHTPEHKARALKARKVRAILENGDVFRRLVERRKAKGEVGII